MSTEIGRYNRVIGYNENVDEVLNVLRNSGKIWRMSDIMKEAIAKAVWGIISSRYSHDYVCVYQEDLEKVISKMKADLENI